MNISPLSSSTRAILFIASLLIVGFGQPIWGWLLGLVAGTIGFGLFWRILLDFPVSKTRFWLGTVWFSGVQCIQLFWMIDHPYAYIYAVYFLIAFANGLLFGTFSLFITASLFQSWIPLLGLSSVWTLLEWSRLFFLSGYSLNPVGLALTGSVYALQAASLFGVFGLSFWVIFVNLAGLRAWLKFPKLSLSFFVFLVAAVLPTAHGTYQIAHREQALQDAPRFRSMLVQTAFPIEEILEFQTPQEYASFILDEWIQILTIMRAYKEQKVDLIALPEYVVPFGTYSFVYPHEVAETAFRVLYGQEASSKLPPKELPFAKEIPTSQGSIWAVNNAFWAQGLANIFDAPLIAGLEDAEEINGDRVRYSGAIQFTPHTKASEYEATRYAKRVLVPMAEYIPFSFCQKLAAQYGITGSFTCGEHPLLYRAGNVPYGISICYEETFGDLMRESRLAGAELLVNLTSDVWFPGSLLPYQHLEHARLRSVENGIPLIRSCNTGITTAIDSLGRSVATFGKTREEQEWAAGCLIAEVPLYTYSTFYTLYGDKAIVLITILLCFIWGCFYLLKINRTF